MMMFRVPLLLVVLLAGWPAGAAVTLTFYARELGARFPHAFVHTTGATDAEPDVVIDANYGFTAKRLTPALLTGPVPGEIVAVDGAYIAKSDPHLTLTLSDDQYRRVLATVERWRGLPGRSYDLNRRNCVHFVGDVARAVGLRVTDPPALMKRPRSYLIDLARMNR